MSEGKYTIGKLAEQAGVKIETIRHYEDKGLIKKPVATTGYRKYPEDDIAKIKFVKRTQELGFTLKEAKELLELRVKSTAKCGQVKKKAEEKFIEVEKKIKDLQKMKKTLGKMIQSCSSEEKSATDCPILDCFEGDKK